MEIEFRTRKLKKTSECLKDATRKWGSECARKLIQRLNEIDAAETLDVLLLLPGPRCHALKQDRAGQYAVDLKHPFRLVFEPSGDPADYTERGLINPKKVTKVRIMEVVDYHG